MWRQPMRKAILFCLTVLLPAIAVGISNFGVFADAAWLATIALAVTAGIAAVFTWASGDATPKIARYAIYADFVICLVLCLNFAAHWLLSREISAAKQNVTERHVEEDRQLDREKAKTELEIARKQAEAELTKQQTAQLNAERRRLAQLPIEQRHSALQAPMPETKPQPTIQPMSLVSGSAVAMSVPVQ